MTLTVVQIDPDVVGAVAQRLLAVRAEMEAGGSQPCLPTGVPAGLSGALTAFGQLEAQLTGRAAVRITDLARRAEHRATAALRADGMR